MNVLADRTILPARLRRLVTAQELEKLPSNERYELIRGELCAMPNNSAEHGYKTMLLSVPVVQFVVDNDLGWCFAAETRFTVYENPDTVLGPDFAFVTKDRIPAIPARGYLRFAPDLVVETRSPGDTRTEFGLKVSMWLQYGTRVVWALDPATASLVVHRPGKAPITLGAEDTLLEPELLPGFALPLRNVLR